MELGVVALLVRSARGIATSGLRVETAVWYSDVDRPWKPVDVKMEMPLVVLPWGEATAGRRRAARTVRVEGGVTVKLCRGRGREGVAGVLWMGGIVFGCAWDLSITEMVLECVSDVVY